jgi:hypothetical protein
MTLVSQCPISLRAEHRKEKTPQGKTQTLIDASKEDVLETNTEKTKHMLLSHHQNAGQNRDIKRDNRCLESVTLFRYLGTAVINRNSIVGEIKRRLNSSNACYYSVQNILSSRLSRYIKIRTYTKL